MEYLVDMRIADSARSTSPAAGVQFIHPPGRTVDLRSKSLGGERA